jgi:addiction module RelE/StbE family toxin
MNISYSKTFIKQAKKLSPSLRLRLQQKITVFSQNPLHESLRNHALKGSFGAYRSIDITGDVRALYLQRDDEAIFDLVGMHSQLYG